MEISVGKAWRRFLVVPLLLVLGAIGLTSCYEDYGLTTQDYDSYITSYTPGTNFQKFRYFVMPDTIVHIYDTTQTDPLKSARKFDKQILSLVSSNLEARGYTRLASLADVVDSSVTVVVMNAQFSSEFTGYYYNYWYPYWGWYYPYYPGYYPPTGGTYSYTTGTNVTLMSDMGMSRQEKRLDGIWVGIISGLTGSSSTAGTRISTGINKIFEQSPYLYAGQ
jgi:hypothetical protein